MTRPKRSRGMPKRASVDRRPNRMPLLLVGGLVVLVLVAAVGSIVLSAANPDISQPAASVEVSGTALPALPDSGTDPAIGRSIPTLSGTGMDGKPMTISADGRAKVIVILAHWCPHCQAELPRLVDWLGANDVPAGVDIVGLTTAIAAERPNYPPSKWFEREDWKQPTLIDDANDTGLNALGIGSFPGFVFVGPNGQVQQRLTGEISTDQFAQWVAFLGAMTEAG
jgi:cytochrome c biogenesis protein CcmG/thiol:disulfide interchange protein DsbE